MATDIQAAQQNRLSLFANVFKGYMGIMPTVTAALAPILTAMNALPSCSRIPMDIQPAAVGLDFPQEEHRFLRADEELPS